MTSNTTLYSFNPPSNEEYIRGRDIFVVRRYNRINMVHPSDSVYCSDCCPLPPPFQSLHGDPPKQKTMTRTSLPLLSPPPDPPAQAHQTTPDSSSREVPQGPLATQAQAQQDTRDCSQEVHLGQAPLGQGPQAQAPQDTLGSSQAQDRRDTLGSSSSQEVAQGTPPGLAPQGRGPQARGQGVSREGG